MNEVITNLYLGDREDARRAAGFAVLNVMWHGEEGIPDTCRHIPTTKYQMWQEFDDGMTRAEGVLAVPVLMDLAADWIQARLARGEKVLVHCAFGIERSPLTVVWYLMRHAGMDLKEAYAHVMRQRPQAQYRGTWLPESVRITGQLPDRQTKEVTP